jgi:hypothetical protein
MNNIKYDFNIYTKTMLDGIGARVMQRKIPMKGIITIHDYTHLH